MKGIDPSIAEHSLNISPIHKPVKQKLRQFGEDKFREMTDKVNKLLTSGFIREVEYPSWLANVVLVKKYNGKWRMCVDYTNLNQACTKDYYPLPCIDAPVDSTSGYEFRVKGSKPNSRLYKSNPTLMPY